ncbi:MAG: hypothetical protein HRU33_22220 [Rhodobacteraceae bacterium]|nr:hypothetical protein [Paracoccaceae bacterium]
METPNFAQNLIHRFLIHFLPDGFHRTLHYGLLARAGPKANITKICTLLGAQAVKQDAPPPAKVIPLPLREFYQGCRDQFVLSRYSHPGNHPFPAVWTCRGSVPVSQLI